MLAIVMPCRTFHQERTATRAVRRYPANIVRTLYRGKQADPVSLTLMGMDAIHTLLRQAIDYAGLFPPAGLDMSAAVNNYVTYREGPDAWALGRFIVPATRLSEFAEEAARRTSGLTWPWELSVLIGADRERDLAILGEFERQPRFSIPAIEIKAIEMKAESAASIAEASRRIPEGLQVYVEVPTESDPADLLASAATASVRLKVRTGGITPDAFPTAVSLDRFIRGCLRAKVPFKATAGLHHAVRGEYPLTYEERSPRGTMFGFLNLFLAAAMVQAGSSESETQSLLVETSPDAFQLQDRAVYWRDHRLGTDQLRQARESIISFGSCSFTEPITEVQALQSHLHQA
jgi:hypothetical protein